MIPEFNDDGYLPPGVYQAMNIQNEQELEVTQEKLQWLEQRLAEIRNRPAENPRAHEWTIRTFKKQINQFTEEIVRYKSRIGASATESESERHDKPYPMGIRDERELENTQEKLRLLEEHYAKRKLDPVDDARARELSLRSLKRIINQLHEEIVRFESHAALQQKKQ